MFVEHKFTQRLRLPMSNEDGSLRDQYYQFGKAAVQAYHPKVVKRIYR